MSRTSRSDNYSDPSEPVSVVEDLDPEPPESAGKWRVAEMVLGLALVLGILTWGLGTWWQDESNSKRYEQGRLAASEHRWDDAVADFSAAPGYKDADALAADAARQVGERDRQYTVAVAHEKTGPAAMVLQAARAVQTIQPGYKDVDNLAAEAEDQVYTDALSGTVVMRTLAQPPGLYYRGPGGWHYLQGSDPWSSVLSYPLSDATQKYIVYDMPGPGWSIPTPTAIPTAGQNSYQMLEGSPDKAGRQLMLATLGGGTGEPDFQSLLLDPAEYNTYICGAAGVWGVRYNMAGTNSIIARGGFDYISKIDYERVSSPLNGQAANQGGSISPDQGVEPPGWYALIRATTAKANTKPTTAMAATAMTATVVFPGTLGTVADFGHRSDMLLLAAYAPSVDGKTNTVLYVAGGDGSHPSAVYRTTGTLVSAALSPDDRYALVVMASAPLDIVGKVTVSAVLVALDTTGNTEPTPPVTIQEISMDGVNTIAGVHATLVSQLTISGVFLEKGAFENKLLLGWYDSASATSAKVRLVDVRNPLQVLCETSVNYADEGFLPVIEQDDGRTLLLFDQGFRPTAGADKPMSVDLRMLHADTRTDGPAATTTVTAKSYELPLPQTDIAYGDIRYLSNPTLRGDDLIYQTETVNGASGQMTHNAYSLPLAAANNLQGTSVQPAPLFQSVLPSGPPGWLNDVRSGIVGPSAFAYIDAQGTLHARAYDAEVDLPLERGIGAVVALKTTAYSYYKSLR